MKLAKFSAKLVANFRRSLEGYFRASFAGKNRQKHFPPKLRREFHHETSLRGSGLWRALQNYVTKRTCQLSGTKKEPKPKLLSPDIFRWGRGLPRARVGAKKFGMSLETREIKLFWRDIPGFCWDIPAVPEKFEKKRLVFSFRSLMFVWVLHNPCTTPAKPMSNIAVPEKFEKKKFVFNFWPLSWTHLTLVRALRGKLKGKN